MTPSYIALDAGGGFFVSDTGNKRLLHFDRDGGNPKALWKGEEKPWAVAYAESALEWFFPDAPALFLVLEGVRGWSILKLDPGMGRY